MEHLHIRVCLLELQLKNTISSQHLPINCRFYLEPFSVILVFEQGNLPDDRNLAIGSCLHTHTFWFALHTTRAVSLHARYAQIYGLEREKYTTSGELDT